MKPVIVMAETKTFGDLKKGELYPNSKCRNISVRKYSGLRKIGIWLEYCKRIKK